MLYMVTFTINIPPMLAYIPAPWILWVWIFQAFPAMMMWIPGYWQVLQPTSGRSKLRDLPTSLIPSITHMPYAPCMEYLPTFALKITQM